MVALPDEDPGAVNAMLNFSTHALMDKTPIPLLLPCLFTLEHTVSPENLISHIS